MNDQTLRIPKKLQAVTLWIHPEGRVDGSIYLHLQSTHTSGEERPQEVLNHGDPFLVLKYDNPEGCRFYNKRAVVRVHYDEEDPRDFRDCPRLPCCLRLMDGALLKGEIRELLPPENSRLYDYINASDEPFLKLHGEDGTICLVNKDYIVRVTPGDET